MSKDHLLAEYKNRHYYIFSKTQPKTKQIVDGVAVVTAKMLF